MALEGLTPPASGRMGGVGGGAVLAEGVKGLMSGVVDDAWGCLVGHWDCHILTDPRQPRQCPKPAGV